MTIAADYTSQRAPIHYSTVFDGKTPALCGKSGTPCPCTNERRYVKCHRCLALLPPVIHARPSADATALCAAVPTTDGGRRSGARLRAAAAPTRSGGASTPEQAPRHAGRPPGVPTKDLMSRKTIVVVALALLIGGCRREDDEAELRTQLPSSLLENAARNALAERHELNFATLVPQAWDRVFVFRAYSSPEYMTKALGFYWRGGVKSASAVRDRYQLVAFVRGKEVVAWADFDVGVAVKTGVLGAVGRCASGRKRAYRTFATAKRGFELTAHANRVVFEPWPGRWLRARASGPAGARRLSDPRARLLEDEPSCAAVCRTQGDAALEGHRTVTPDL